MKTRAVRLYGKNDLRLEEFELPPIKDDEILAKVISDSLCMSSYKEAVKGQDHKRVPSDIKNNPIIIGHEFCGELVEVGAKWKKQYKPGEKFAIQPAINYMGEYTAIGYSYPYCGGNATYIIIPPEAIITGSLLKYDSDIFYYGSLAEPMSCIVAGYHEMYHKRTQEHKHDMGIKQGGNMAILAGVGPMGLGAIDYAIHSDRRPGLLVVTDIDENRLKRAESLYTVSEAAKNEVELHYVNTRDSASEHYIMELTDKKGYDDVFVFAPIEPVIAQGDRILGQDGCMNFFAGPTKTELTAPVNFYNVHYADTHIVGSAGGNAEDMKECLDLIFKGTINPSAMITHIGGLNAAVEATLNLPKIPGGKKLIYNHMDMPLTAIADFEKLAEKDEMFAELNKLVKANNGLWNAQAEKCLLKYVKPMGAC